MYERSYRDAGGGVPAGAGDAGRSLELGVTFGGAGRLAGDLTPGCSAAVAAVLEALGKRAGPEDTRTAGQRRHDALAEACRRLVRAGMLPARAGQPTQVMVHLTLAQLRGAPGASAVEAAWAAARASRPGGLAGRLRATLDGGPLTAVSLPLDIGAATETIPAHLMGRAVTTRHDHCAFPGCDQPASVCDIHHITPRSRGGPTSLANLVPLCSFHHLTAVHRWGWTLTLNPDATTTATSPDHARTLHSHGPPTRAA
jgi:Domain of unknown function (DUF222)/HNH endonuclease